MNLFKKLFKSNSSKTGIVFIVEDNIPYATTLQSFIKINFARVKEVKCFPVGETCLVELYKNPDVIIVDYFLDTKYADAESGLEIIKQIRKEKPKVGIIVLSGQNEIGVVLEIVKQYGCAYIKKDEHALDRLKVTLNELL